MRWCRIKGQRDRSLVIRHCERSEAIHSCEESVDCFVATLLAMTSLLSALPQPRQHLQSAVTVSGQQPHLGLIIPDRLHGVVADAAVGTAGVEARLGETDLHFLHFGACQRALRTWERLDERRCAENAVAEMTARQRVIHRWIVTAHGVESRPQQEGWSALHRHPHLRSGTWLRKRLAVD